MMKLPFTIPNEELVRTYDSVRNVLGGHEGVIFEAMTQVAPTMSVPFAPPATAAEFENKHNQIKRQFERNYGLGRQELAVRLMDQVAQKAFIENQVPPILGSALLNAITFNSSSPKVRYRMIGDRRWALEWELEYQGSTVQVLLTYYDHQFGHIVSEYVVHYVHTAIQAYTVGMYGVTMALLSVVVESVLRDYLETRGYRYNPYARRRDEYDTVQAQVTAGPTSYEVRFQPGTNLTLTDFTANHGAQPIDVKIRRKIRDNASQKVDLVISNPTELLDYWSSSAVIANPEHNVSGLGAALDIARNVANVLSPDDLPLDIDPVLTAVRNNSIHLSARSLDATVPAFNYLTEPRACTVRDLLKFEGPILVFTRDIVNFISTLYTQLREQGHLITE